MRLAVLCVILVLFAGTCSGAEIPADSLTKLQDIFGGVRDGLWEENDVFWHQGDFDRCIATLQLITELDPHDSEAFSDASWLMWNQGRRRDAELLLQKGLALNPDEDTFYVELGHFCYFRKRFDEAIGYLETAVSYPTHWLSWHLLAHAYEHAGNRSEAMNIWLMMEARDPSFNVPQIQIERILAGGPPPTVTEPAVSRDAVPPQF